MAIRKSSRFRTRSEVPIADGNEPETSTASLLTEEERAEIEDTIIAEIEEEERERLRAAYKVEAKEKFRREKGLAEEQVTLTIDVAGHAQDIKLDGRPFYHGHTYTVPRSIADTLFDIMGRTWDHEESVGGANQNEYRKPRNTRMLGGRPVTGAPMQSGAQAASVPVQNKSISPLSAGRLAPKVTTTQSLRD